jgi:hypothetical protein
MTSFLQRPRLPNYLELSLLYLRCKHSALFHPFPLAISRPVAHSRQSIKGNHSDGPGRGKQHDARGLCGMGRDQRRVERNERHFDMELNTFSIAR